MTQKHRRYRNLRGSAVKDNEDSAALTPEIARSLDAVDGVAPKEYP